MPITDRLSDDDPSQAPGDLDAVVTTLKDAVTRSSEPVTEELDPNAQQATAQNSDQKVDRPDYIEAKFWTGDLTESLEKQAKGYRELHSAYGRMANDLGTQRKITDQLLLGKRDADLDGSGATPPKRTPPKVDSSKLVDNPTETLDEYMTAREKALREEWESEQRQAQMAAEEQAFLAKHPNFNEIANSEEFGTWINSSPLRLRAAQMAGQGDYSVADELFTEFSALQGNGPAPVDRDDKGNNVVVTDETDAARKVGTESAANAPSTSGTTGGKPIYRRADLIALKQTRPEVYADPVFQAEILQAYAEKRVK